MNPHPDFETTNLPREADIGGFRLSRLDASVMDEDFQAVTDSTAVLTGLFGNDWPQNLTAERNLTDLHWHDREFTVRRSFSWVIRDLTGSYLGCAYLLPDPGARGMAQVFTWVRDMPDRVAINRAFDAELASWFADLLPGDLTLRWKRPD